LYAVLGELREAEKRFAATRQASSLALLAFYRGDLQKAKMVQPEPEVLPLAERGMGVLVMIRSGRLAEAEAVRQRLTQVNEGPVGLLVLDAELALARSRTAKGVGLLEKVMASNPPAASLFLIAAEHLADLYIERGKLVEARTVLHNFIDRAAVGPTFQAAFRMRLQMKLAQLDRELGRADEAQKIEADLRKRLIFADADHPIRVALNHAQNSAPPLVARAVGQ
jgi:hypothetical protein